jgi:hypothetical protein
VEFSVKRISTSTPSPEVSIHLGVHRGETFVDTLMFWITRIFGEKSNAPAEASDDLVERLKRGDASTEITRAHEHADHSVEFVDLMVLFRPGRRQGYP